MQTMKKYPFQHQIRMFNRLHNILHVLCNHKICKITTNAIQSAYMKTQIHEMHFLI